MNEVPFHSKTTEITTLKRKQQKPFQELLKGFETHDSEIPRSSKMLRGSQQEFLTTTKPSDEDKVKTEKPKKQQINNHCRSREELFLNQSSSGQPFELLASVYQVILSCIRAEYLAPRNSLHSNLTKIFRLKIS